MTPRTFLIVLVVLSACTPSSDQTSSSDPGQVEEAAVMGPTVSVDEIADDVYRFSYNNHRSLFIATTDGVLVTDPQSTEAAERYLEEIRKITDAPIRYLVYSHYHNDHASGGAVFGDDVVTISHENVLTHLEDEGMTEVRPPDETFVEEMSLTSVTSMSTCRSQDTRKPTATSFCTSRRAVSYSSSTPYPSGRFRGATSHLETSLAGLRHSRPCLNTMSISSCLAMARSELTTMCSSISSISRHSHVR